jgi:dihydropyrimidinase
MSRNDYWIRNGVVVSGRGLHAADVVVRDGIIESVGDPPEPIVDAREIDASGKLVLPGIIDAHLHPVYADRIDTLSRAAVTGGVTTLIPYVGAVKAWGQGGDLVESVKAFIEEGESHSLVDFGVHCTFTQNEMTGVDRSIPELISMGVASFKGFTAYKKRGMKLEDEELLKVMGLIAEQGGLFATHCENGPVLDHLEESYQARGWTRPECYPPTHPGIAEAEAVFRVLTLAQVVGCPMYLPHLSARESLDVVALFRKWQRQTIFTETCPHYLTLTAETLKTAGTPAKMSPPLREAEDLDALWDAVATDKIDVIGSDAAGHSLAANEPHFSDVFSAPNGIPGVDTLFTVTYDAGINRGRMTLPQLVRMTSENPARIFGLFPRKGILAPGSDADLVIFDPNRLHTIPDKNPCAKVDYSLYAGRRCLGAPELVMQRGQVVFAGGEVREGGRSGCYLAAQINTEHWQRVHP